MKTYRRTVVNVIRPSVFANCYSSHLGSYLPTKLRDRDTIFVDDYFSKGWFPGLREKHLGATRGSEMYISEKQR